MPLPVPGGGGSGTALTTAVITQALHGFAVGDAVYLDPNTNIWTLASNDIAEAVFTVGLVASVPNVNDFTVTSAGQISGLTAVGPVGTVWYLSETGTTGNTLTNILPTTGAVRPILIADSAASGYVQEYTVGAAVSEYLDVTSITDSQTTTSLTFVDVTGGTINIPSAGTWTINYVVNASSNTINTGAIYMLTDSSNVEVPFSTIRSGSGAAGTRYAASQQATVITTGAKTYKLRWRVTAASTATLYNDAASSSANSTIFAEKISGLSAAITSAPIYDSYANDAGAAGGGVPVGGVYLNTTNNKAHTRMT